MKVPFFMWSVSASSRLEIIKAQRKLTSLRVPLASQWALFIKF